jgi:uncharacterized BrkB/YihY/UPF0761 family membrane protein
MGEAAPSRPPENDDLVASPRSRLEGVRARVEATTERATAAATTARRRSHVVDTAFDAYERDRRSVGGVLAGAIAFRLFVYLLPVFLAGVTLLGAVSSLDPKSPEQIAKESGLSGYLVKSVGTAADQSKKSLWILVPLSLWALYTAGLGALKVLRAIHALAWGEPITKVRRGALGTLVLFGIALAIAALLALLQRLRGESFGLGLGSTLATTFVFFGFWLLASRLLPHGEAPWRALVPGAVLVAVGVEGLHLASVYSFGRRVESASALYGSLGVAAVIIAWLYLIGRLMVASAMLNATFWERRQARSTPTS